MLPEQGARAEASPRSVHGAEAMSQKKKRGFPRLLSYPLYAASTSVTEITVEPENLMSSIQVRIHTPFALTGVIA